MGNIVKWFEIPVVNMDRAVAFYSAVLQRPLKLENFHGTQMAVFGRPEGEAVISGALIHNGTKPSDAGALVYFEAGDLDAALARVPSAGGRVVKAKTSIGPMGSYAIIADTEGNQVGLHVNA